jgi:hydroxypyruvate isomerase
MRLDVCLDSVFPEAMPMAERIALTAAAGYDCAEFWVQEGKDAAEIKQACAQYKVAINNIVVNVPDGSIGYSPVNAAELNQYLERVEKVIAFAKSIDCSKAITCTGNLQPGLSRSQMRANLENAYGKAAEIAARNNFTLLVESLNTYVDHEGYYLDSSHEGAEIVRAINSPNLRLLYDVYHMQIMEGNLISNIQKHLDVIGHFHSAGVPGRNELFMGEINYPAILTKLDEWGYKGCFGLEYFPKMADPKASMCAVREYLLGK